MEYVSAENFHNKKTCDGTAPSDDTIWNESSEQHQHQRTKKHHNQCPICTFLMPILKHILIR